ncbi:uncharacterized protein EV422DRAFT_532330 [Fimicolochytrium jonesii]|uniref:uncharacterized protein n=1 Tax=Fimicolochytrium jonesii TaxID=1396493 RepID=UPI0022FE39CD|nr:uncharacterized protein EV422DRAFT_532330 [Fimicolochytrium jonesii]KAI8820297.1 hypothetical protein EV422DRAFT_532330 [Fimicolochytrium jonesii]
MRPIQSNSFVELASEVDLQQNGLLSIPRLSHTSQAPPPYDAGTSEVVPSDSFEELFQQRPIPLGTAQLASPGGHEAAYPPPAHPQLNGETRIDVSVPIMNIVIQIVGSRGDVQPFLALAKELQIYGHRVRIATHETFRAWIRRNEVEFYPIGGDPAVLMAFMVENKGLIPSYASIAKGDIGSKRKMIREILRGSWKSCVEADEETGQPFRASVIIANPPSFGHIHCAEKLSIPLHMSFTMPWVRTISFPHPLTNIEHSKTVHKLVNKMSYGVVDTLTWLGVGDVINEFRRDVLGLKRMGVQQGTETVEYMEVPWTFCWSPSLIPKPVDWGPNIAISGFYFLDQANNYTPPPDLSTFLNLSPAPIYIGFGSITGQDPGKFTSTILQAVQQAGVRAIISKGWMNMGGGESGAKSGIPDLGDKVLFIGDCPHDWLFQHVAAVVHHGGAGTLSAGLRCGKPTVVVPFFGDQFFWGAMVYRMKAGPLPVPAKDLTASGLAAAITTALSPATVHAAQHIANQMAQENGVKLGVASLHASLPLSTTLHSALNSTYAASLYAPKHNLQLSQQVAQVLVATGAIAETELEFLRTERWFIPHEHDGIPGTGAVRVLMDRLSNVVRAPVAAARREREKGGGVFARGLVGVWAAILALCWLACCPYEMGYYTLIEVGDFFRRFPLLYDRYSREQSIRPINNFGVGLIEGFRQIAVGVWAAFADIFRRPVQYGRSHGCFLGFFLGLLIGCLNVTKALGGLLTGVGCWLKGAVRQAAKRKRAKKVFEGELGVQVPPRTPKKWWWQRRKPRVVEEAWWEEAGRKSGFERAECERIVREFEMVVEKRRNSRWWRSS